LLGKVMANATLFGQATWWSGFPNWNLLDVGEDHVEVCEIDFDGSLTIHYVTRHMILDAFDKIEGEILGRIVDLQHDGEDIDALLQTAVFGKLKYA
tara:strand:- start:452 stop:739 length:288 start_codon:yes stop_codon:yes gene_type:complete